MLLPDMTPLTRRLKLFLILPLCAGMLLLHAPAAHADANDEGNLRIAVEAVNSLWDFVEQSGNLEDDAFYPQFAEKATSVRQKIDQSYSALLTTQETGDTLDAVYQLQKDVVYMGQSVDAWKSAALAKDDLQFQNASDKLGDFMDNQLDQDINQYNATEYGKHTVSGIALHAGVPAFAFLLTCLLFASALFRDEKQEHDAGKELMRRLRWRRAYSATAILAGSAVPAGIFFIMARDTSRWLWLCLLPGIGFLSYVQYLYLRTWMMIRSQQ